MAEEFDRRLAQGADPYQVLQEILRGKSWSGDSAARWTGQRRGGFLFERVIGIGGMGATFEAEDQEGRRVAVKVVTDVAGDVEERFGAECRMLAALDHPGIVRYLQSGVLSDGHGYLVMELVRGCDLQQALDEIARGSPEHEVGKTLLGDADPTRPGADPGYRQRILRILGAAAEALAHAHDKGILHRDLKPANIVLDRDLTPRLVDFGLGLDLFGPLASTRSSAMAGTVVYMAPEQLRGEHDAIGPQTDVFSLGLVLYRCLIGRELHANLQQAMDSARNDSQIRRRQLAGLPRDLQAVLYKCLENRPRRRYPSAGELAADLRALLDGRPVRARLPSALARGLRTRRGRALAVALPAALLAVAGGFWLTRPPHLLTIDALFDLVPAKIILDGIETDYVLPLVDQPIAPGDHVVEYRVLAGGYPGIRAYPIRKRFRVEEGQRHTRVTLLNVPAVWPSDACLTELPPGESAFLQVACVPEARRFVDGTEIDRDVRWLRVAPGRHRIEARAPDGTGEVQEVELAPTTLHVTALLPRRLAGVRGSYRRTLASPLGPFPPDVHLELDGAVVFLNDAQNGNFEFGNMVDSTRRFSQWISTNCYVTAAEAGREATAVLRVEFPEPMRSIVFYLNYAQRPYTSGFVWLDYRAEGMPWTQVPELWIHDPLRGVGQAPTPPQGSRWLELRGRIRAASPPVTFAVTHWFTTYLDHITRGTVPGCEVVADPDPGVARRPF